ncbi:hypothetical protein [Candidatus Entotheonella palauensis]|uniref:hypothetical protein n=1 Tax=Candidatus Entotheonella palauensis TaxID=93172 RepID=UPI000B7F54F7|nr:hypothetical protein [Candidatus Entotheonella palauensis]
MDSILAPIDEKGIREGHEEARREDEGKEGAEREDERKKMQKGSAKDAKKREGKRMGMASGTDWW